MRAGFHVIEVMTENLSSTRVPTGRLFCRIDVTDVEAMLDAYDKDLSDSTTANCISRVIARQLSGDQNIRLIRQNGTRAELEILGRRILLPDRLFQWLVTAEKGSQVEAIDFILRLPETGAGGIVLFPGRIPLSHQRHEEHQKKPAQHQRQPGHRGRSFSEIQEEIRRVPQSGTRAGPQAACRGPLAAPV